MASRSGEQTVSTVQCIFGFKYIKHSFLLFESKVLPVRTVVCLGRQKNFYICIVMCSLDKNNTVIKVAED